MSPASLSERAAIWAVLPCKPLAEAKGRLAHALGAGQRLAFARAMFEDVLAAVLAARQLAGVLVVSRDPEIRAIGRSRGARTLSEDARGLNDAVAEAAEQLAALGAAGMVVVPADVPTVTSADIDRVVRSLHPPAAGRQAVTIVAARDGNGTNAVGLSPCNAIAPAFGPGSFVRHCALALVAGVEPAILDLPNLAFDIDTPNDLADFRRERIETRSSAMLTAPARPAMDAIHRVLTAAVAGQ